MRVDFLTLFPEMIRSAVSYSIPARAQAAGLLDVGFVNIRDYTHDRHRTADDAPYGGGAGMVMKVEPIAEALDALDLSGRPAEVILLGAHGQPFHQKMAEELAARDRLVFICGHYEGVDERVRQNLVSREISIGDYVLTGGELPALVVLDAVVRLLPGVLGSDESTLEESFTSGLLEYPQYTRPEEYRGWKVPQELLSGHHANIRKWRRVQALKATLQKRPELLKTAKLTEEDLRILEDFEACGSLSPEDDDPETK